MTLSDVLAFIVGDEPEFRRPDAHIRPGDKFGRYEGRDGWIYVEVLELNDGRIPDGCVYARAYSPRVAAGREGYCRLSELDLRLDDAAWAVIRANRWRAPGCALRFDDLPGHSKAN
jgi:hypothetical protein